MRASEAGAAQVAEVCISALRLGPPPSRAAQATYGVSRPTAVGWIRQAKDEGLVPHRSFTGTRSKKLRAVARALGVDPADLAQAAVEHANGDLRVQYSAVEAPRISATASTETTGTTAQGTQHRTSEGWFYLAVVLDCFSRRLVG